MNGPAQASQRLSPIKPRRQGSTCLNRLVFIYSFSPQILIPASAISAVSLSLPLLQPPPLHPSFTLFFGPIDQSTLIIWLLSSLLFFYFYNLLTPFIQSQHAHSISFARPPDSLFSNSLQERRPLPRKNLRKPSRIPYSSLRISTSPSQMFPASIST